MRFVPTKYRTKLELVLYITVAWILIGIFLAFYNPVIFDYETGTFVTNIPENHGILQHLLINLIGPALGGVIGGSLIVFYLRERLKKMPYGQLLLTHSAIYLLVIFLIVIITLVINSSSFYQEGFLSPKVLQRVENFVYSYGVLKIVVTWYIITIFTVFILQVNDKYGPGVLKNFLLGKYHQPRREHRIFMFLDLKSSTTIAEHIGHAQYFRLLKDFFAEITDPIINAQGEIYQYVGDEIVVSWPLSLGLKNTNCLRCFFDIQECISTKADEFLKKYGVVPEFKAGMHWGEVTVGEIGIIKKDIVFTGDVLNTTARIMELCKQYPHSLIISEALCQQCPSKNHFQLETLGKMTLRGKSEAIGVFGVITTSGKA